MKKTALVATVAAAALALSACSGGGGGSASGSTDTALNIGQFADITSWDPAEADIGFDVNYLSAVYDPLLTVDKDGEPQAALATQWKVSDDFKTVTMDLRKGVKFSDGQTFDADAAITNLNHLKKGTRSQEAYKNVADFKKVDDDTIEIDLKRRDDTMLYLMALGRSWMASPKAIKAGTLGKKPVGSGPYTLKSSSVAGSEYDFAKVSKHWDADTYKGDPLKIMPIPDETARANAMSSGQINVDYASQTELDQADSNGWKVAAKVSGWVGLQFPARADSSSPIGNLKVRQALNYAFDGAKILKSIGNGAGKTTNQIFPVGTAANRPDLDDQYSYNLAKAKQLMKEAGYEKGFSLHMPMAGPFQVWQPTAEQVFKDLGIKVTWDQMQYPDYQSKAPSYDMFIAFISIDSNAMANVERQITTSQWYNPKPGVAAFPKVKAQVEKVTEADPDHQLEQIKKLDQLVTDEAFFSVWYQSDNSYVSTPNITVTPVTGQMYPTLNHITVK